MDQLKEFWRLVLEVWNTGVGGVDIGKALVAILILAVFFLLRGLFTRLVIGRLNAIAKRTTNRLDDKMVDSLEAPVRLVPIVIGVFFASEYLAFEDIYADIADNVVKTLIAVCIFWGAYRLTIPMSFLLRRLERVFTHELVEWLVKAIHVAVIVVGAATILQIWGIQVGPIIAGAGLFGVAVALGAQDLFKNLIAGILILGEKRFRTGDWIRVEGTVEGTVESIGFRSTVVRRFDKAPVLVPNARLADTAVINFSGMTHRRIYWTIGVEYRTTIEQLRRIRDEIERYVVDSSDFADPEDVSTFVRIDRFSDSSIDIMLYCFTRTTDWGEWLKIKEGLALRIKEIVEGAGTGFAFPSQSLYVEQIPSERPEIFVPPSTGGSNMAGREGSSQTEEKR